MDNLQTGMVAPLAEVEVTVVHTQPSSAGDIGLRTEQDVVKKWSSVLSTVLHSAIAGKFLSSSSSVRHIQKIRT